MQADTTRQQLLDNPISIVQQFYTSKADGALEKRAEVSNLSHLRLVQLQKLLSAEDNAFPHYVENLLGIESQEVPNLDVSFPQS